MTSFSELISNPQLLKAIEQLGYESATAVQQQTIPQIVAGHDLLVCSKTGSGKTAAFLFPSFQKILAEPKRNPQSTRILILTPTRELARQILKVAQQIVKTTSLTAGMICGGEDFKYQQARLRKNPEILVATPGRLLEHIQRKSTDFSGLDFLILDEADRMLDMGLSDDVLEIAKACDTRRQTLLFSATLEPEGLKHLIKQVVLQKAVELNIEEPQNNIQQKMLLTDDIRHKEKVLLALLQRSSYEKVIVFANTKIRVDEIAKYLQRNDIQLSFIHGDVSQDDRRVSLDAFRFGRKPVLIATDVAARGLDIKGVDLVINLDVAHSGDEYLHRIGRTGRADQAGVAITFVSAKDWNLTKGIERYLGVELEMMHLPGFEAAYKGPDKLKNSGKAVGTKKKTQDDSAKTKNEKPKVKVRERDKKNVGKRRKPSGEKGIDGKEMQSLGDGFSVFKPAPKK